MRSINSSPSRSADKQSTLASLCRRLISAVMLSWQGQARTPRYLVGCHGHADAGATDENAALDTSFTDCLGHAESEIGIIDALSVLGTNIHEFMAESLQQSHDAPPGLVSAMIAAYGNFHGPSPESLLAWPSLLPLYSARRRARRADRRGRG